MFLLQWSKVTLHSSVSICKVGADIPEPSGPLEAIETLELVEICVDSVQDRKLAKVTELRREFVLLCTTGRLYSVCFACRAEVSLKA